MAGRLQSISPHEVSAVRAPARSALQGRHGHKAPHPLDPSIHIEKWPRDTLFVRSFGGFATEATILNQVRAPAVLCRAVLCCAVLHWPATSSSRVAVLRCAMLCCAVLCCSGRRLSPHRLLAPRVT